MNKKQRRTLLRLVLTTALLVGIPFLPSTDAMGDLLNRTLRFVLYLIPYLIVGHDILLKAAKGIRNRQMFDENFLMTVATLGALALAVCDELAGRNGDYLEAIAVMLFYQIGELFQSYAVGRSRRDIGALMDIRPDIANLERDGKLEPVDPGEVPVGSVIVVRPGEKVPIDGVIIEGCSNLDTSALTGESVPREANVGDEAVSGCVNLTHVLKVRTTREFGESTVSKILDLMENASSRKSRSENFIARFARLYTPAVCYSALALAILPPLVRWAGMGLSPNWGDWFYRALTFLVISCPCALVISIPLTFFAGLGGASREGILVKGSNFLEMLSEADCVAFDKTGTLTRGVFEVVAVHPEKNPLRGPGVPDETALLHLAAHVERYSTHPIASSLRKAYPNEADGCTVEDVEELAGLGIRARVNGEVICVGNSAFMESIGASWHPCTRTGTIIHIAIDGVYAGHIVISDVMKPHAKEAIASLRESEVKRVVMLTGDVPAAAEQTARELGIDEFYAGLLPADKVTKVEELLAAKAGKKGRVCFVGDGINDAPVLSRADVGIAMGAMGSDAAIEAADVVLMDDDPLKISMAIRLSRRCLRIVLQNIVFSLGVKLACLALGALGIANMWLAVFADVGVMVLAVLNAIRALFTF
ncbi:MAG: cadmium-translocating P-type ATPase [Fretibacterium sp.]|nr:cadmium-translocating P-type ATPase [Fretibacterium sp.]